MSKKNFSTSKNLLIFLTTITLIFNNFQNNLINCHIYNTGDFANEAGLQIYYTSTPQHYFFGSYSGSSTSIRGKIYLMLKDDLQTINQTGIWVGVGFGSSTMKNSDMVMCFYIPEKEFYCEDYYSNANKRPSTDISLGGKNNIKTSSGTVNSLNLNGIEYKTLITFNFEKDLSDVKNDQYDWNEFPSWQTNKKGHSGSYGKMNGRLPNYHTFRTSVGSVSLEDGKNFKNGLKLDMDNLMEKDEKKDHNDNEKKDDDKNSVPTPTNDGNSFGFLSFNSFNYFVSLVILMIFVN